MIALLWKLAWGFRLPVPVIPALVAMALGWGWLAVDGFLDRRAAAREAIERTVTAARISALEEEVALRVEIARRARLLAAEEAVMRQAAETAADELRAAAARSEHERENLDDQIEELLRARPAAGACTVDGDLLRRLHAK